MPSCNNVPIERGCFRYRVYGWVLASDWELADLQEATASPADVYLRLGEASLFDDARSRETFGPSNWFTRRLLPDGTEYLRWSSLFEFLISSDGCTVWAHPLNESYKGRFEVYLLGQVLCFAMVKKGLEPIHATAVVLNGQAVGFIGDCTFGKSTLAAAFLRDGHRLLTDDQLVITHRDGTVMAQPGPPRIKLFPEAARALIGDYVDGVPMNAFTNKLVLPLSPTMSCREPVPLRALYVLNNPDDEHKEIRIEPLSRRESCLEMLRNTSNIAVFEADRVTRQFQIYADLANRTRVRILRYPREFSQVDSVVAAVMADVQLLDAEYTYENEQYSPV